MISLNVLVAIALLVLVALVVIVAAVLAVRRGGRPPLQQDGAQPAAGLECPFCKRRYDPAGSGGRCPHCGAATPR